jgi:hypothetical protein
MIQKPHALGGFGWCWTPLDYCVDQVIIIVTVPLTLFLSCLLLVTPLVASKFANFIFTGSSGNRQKRRFPVEPAKIRFITSPGVTQVDLEQTTTLRINLNVDGASIDSRSHTHPSHFESNLKIGSSCVGPFEVH